MEEAEKELGKDNPFVKKLSALRKEPTEKEVFNEKVGKAQMEFTNKYFRQTGRPSSAGDRLREILYQSKLDEVRQDLLDFEREYGLKYDEPAIISALDIPKEDRRRMVDRLLNRYGYSHLGADLYIKELLDSLKEEDEAFVREIRRDYEDNVKGNGGNGQIIIEWQ